MKIELPISTQYVQHWTAVDGIRELISNAIDGAAGVPENLKIEWVIEPNDYYTLTVANKSKEKLAPASLVLGVSENRNNAAAIGTFGEGMKMAFVTCLRAGLTISAHNHDEKWTIEESYSDTFGVHLPTITIEEDEQKDNWISFKVEGLTHSKMEQVNEQLWDFLDRSQEEFAFNDGEVSVIIGPQYASWGGLFVGGVKMGFLWDGIAVNVPVNMVEVNRDRKAPDNLNHVKKAVRRCIEAALFQSKDEAVLFCQMELVDKAKKCKAAILRLLRVSELFSDYEWGKAGEEESTEDFEARMRYNAICRWVLNAILGEEVASMGGVEQLRGKRVTLSPAVAKEFGAILVSYDVFQGLQHLSNEKGYEWLADVVAPVVRYQCDADVLKQCLQSLMAELAIHVNREEAAKRSLAIMRPFINKTGLYDASREVVNAEE